MADVFRKEYKELSEYQIQTVIDLKNRAQELWNLFDSVSNNKTPEEMRSMALAKTKLEEAVMWAVKGITE